MSLPPQRGGALWPTIFYVAGATLNQGSLVFGSWELGATTDAPGSSIKMSYPSTSGGTNYNATDALQFGIYTFAHAFSTTHDDPIVRMGFNADGTQNGYTNAAWNTNSLVMEGYYWVDAGHIYAEFYNEVLRCAAGTINRRPFSAITNIIDGTFTCYLGPTQIVSSDGAHAIATWEPWGGLSRFYQNCAFGAQVGMGSQTLSYSYVAQIDSSTNSGNALAAFYAEDNGNGGFQFGRVSATASGGHNYGNWTFAPLPNTNTLILFNATDTGDGDNTLYCAIKFSGLTSNDVDIHGNHINLHTWGASLGGGVSVGKPPAAWSGERFLFLTGVATITPSAPASGCYVGVDPGTGYLTVVGKNGALTIGGAATQTSGANLTNSVTAGGTTDTITNWTDLTTYATDAAAIRNAVYQLARKVKQLNDGLRSIGMFT